MCVDTPAPQWVCVLPSSAPCVSHVSLGWSVLAELEVTIPVCHGGDVGSCSLSKCQVELNALMLAGSREGFHSAAQPRCAALCVWGGLRCV